MCVYFYMFNISIQLYLIELEKLQILFLKTLLIDKDQTDTKVSSRILFSRRFQSFIQENMIYWRVNINKFISVVLSF